MNLRLRTAFESEMTLAKEHFSTGNFEPCFQHLERAHILGQRHYGPHVQTHWWMLKAGWRVADRREVLGQIFRILGSAGSLVGAVPFGNTGRASVPATRPMPIPEDLAIFFQD